AARGWRRRDRDVGRPSTERRSCAADSAGSDRRPIGSCPALRRCRRRASGGSHATRRRVRVPLRALQRAAPRACRCSTVRLRSDRRGRRRVQRPCGARPCRRGRSRCRRDADRKRAGPTPWQPILSRLTASVPGAKLPGMQSSRSRLLLIALILVTGAPAAYAPSAIAGVVRDSSGAVLPGVTVEASSPALIEGSRTAVTDGTGQYNIVDLRPGTYAVAFSLTGFRGVKREGIVLPTSFTATVNADLAIGTVEEAITVTGASPLVDVQRSVSQSVMTRETLDTIPTGKDPFAVGQLIAGVTTATPDVGGTQIMQQPTLQVHGSSNNDNVFMVDGVQIQHMGFGGNQTGFYFNDGLMEEISYQTSSLPAEAPVGGVQINMIPHDGGNTFHGSLF